MADSIDRTIPSEIRTAPLTSDDVFFGFKSDIHLIVEYASLLKDALSAQDADDTLLGAQRMLEAVYASAVNIQHGYYAAFPYGEKAQ